MTQNERAEGHRQRGQRIKNASKRRMKKYFAWYCQHYHNGNISDACEALHISRNTIWTWRKHDREFDMSLLVLVETPREIASK